MTQESLFDCPPGFDAAATAADLADRLRDCQKAALSDPTANPVLRLALEIGERLASGAIGWGMLERLVQHLTVAGFKDRAAQLGAYLGDTDIAHNEARLTALFTAMANGSFDDYRRAVEFAGFGIVMTAHPTFTVSGALMHAMNRLATTGDAAFDIAAVAHKPDEPLTLDAEHKLSLEAIGNIRLALRRMWRIAIDVARNTWPEDWRGLTPALVTIASWVGYDLDGRSDISFADMLAKRLLTQSTAFAWIRREIEDLQAMVDSNDVLLALRVVETALGQGAAEISEEIEVFSNFHAGESASREAVRLLSQNLAATQDRSGLLSDHVMPAMDRAIELADEAVAMRLILLRAEIAGNGIALARTHVRINSTQLHNAIRKRVGLASEPDDPRFRQSYLAAITELIATVQPATINFGSLIAERTSAKRLFMTVAQMLKYMDGTIPVRFLIAECESAFTPLVALYYAKLFGIEDRLEICPLFETEKALQDGSRIIGQLIDNPHYRDYLRKVGRLCIQTGYSDAGRFIGQPAATGSIERLKERIIHLFDRHRLDDVELVFFDTHGESVGRGGHPGGVHDRLDYLSPPHVMQMIADRDIRYKQESSFQGGDGYLYFMDEASSLAVLTTILEWRIGSRTREVDPFYHERDYVTEFLTTTKEFQSGLIADPDYAVLLGTYGPNLLYRTGSRATKRMDASETLTRPQISQFRAIPHNAILQQLGLFANTVGGAGEAIEHDPDRFQSLYESSPRFRAIMAMIERGASLSNPHALKAYVDTLDPGLWLLRAAASHDTLRALAFRRIARALEDWNVHAEQVKIFCHLFDDFAQLSVGLQTIGDRQGAGTTLSLLNAIRIAIIHETYVLGTQVPEFSTRNDSANRRVFLQILQLNVPDAVESLKRVFPAHEADSASQDFGEAASYDSEDAQNYEHETRVIFEPLLSIYELMRRISTAIAYEIGCIG